MQNDLLEHDMLRVKQLLKRMHGTSAGELEWRQEICRRGAANLCTGAWHPRVP